MRKLFLLEDDLSLISGLTFAFKKQGFALDTARMLAEARCCGQTENMTCWCWMFPCRMALASISARRCGAHPRADSVPDCFG